jgi:hypothetical protein
MFYEVGGEQDGATPTPMLRSTMLCFAVLCYALLCYALLYYVILPLNTYDRCTYCDVYSD